MLAESYFAHISPKTICRRLKEVSLYGMSPFKKLLLTKKHIKIRYDFGLKYQSLTIDDWKNVSFSDETKLNKRSSEGKVWK